MILIVDNYDSFTYNLVQLVGGLEEVVVKRNDKFTLEEIEELAPDKIIISPGPGRPKDAGLSLAVVREFAGKIPILGVCLGHQVIAQAFGAEIVNAPEIIHGKTAQIKNHGGELLEGLSDFTATRYHSLIVDLDTLADNFTVTASVEPEIIMALEDQELDLYGVQFHPESIMTEVGLEIIKNFIDIR